MMATWSHAPEMNGGKEFLNQEECSVWIPTWTRSTPLVPQTSPRARHARPVASAHFTMKEFIHPFAHSLISPVVGWSLGRYFSRSLNLRLVECQSGVSSTPM